MRSVLKTSRFLYELLSLTTSKTLNCPQPSARYHLLGSFAKHWHDAYAPARASSPSPRPTHGASYQLPVVVVEHAVAAPAVPACGIVASITKSFEPSQPYQGSFAVEAQYGVLPAPHG